MVRLMLTLTPVVCVCGGIVVSDLLSTYLDLKIPTAINDPVDASPKKQKISTSKEKDKEPIGSLHVNSHLTLGIYHLASKTLVVLTFAWYLSLFVKHSTYVTSTAYSSPSVVLASRLADGSQYIIDDYREAYYWLRMNTPDDARVMSWWDYGYQIAGMADRTTLVDNNTWNNTHIAVSFCFRASADELDGGESYV
jgi:dolichyl-diphosphooligosaccharide--protein glycosyltransferase